MFIILSLIVAVAAFNLVSTLVMLVTDKQADIAILRTLGISPRSIMGVFVVRGVIVGMRSASCWRDRRCCARVEPACSRQMDRAYVQRGFLSADIYYINGAVRHALGRCRLDRRDRRGVLPVGDLVSSLARGANAAGGGVEYSDEHANRPARPWRRQDL